MDKSIVEDIDYIKMLETFIEYNELKNISELQSLIQLCDYMQLDLPNIKLQKNYYDIVLSKYPLLSRIKDATGFYEEKYFFQFEEYIQAMYQFQI